MPLTANLFNRLTRLHSLHLRSAHHRSLHTALAERVSSSQAQSYLSTSDVPFVNLAFEQYLLKNSLPDSVILFIYVNRPSVIIGTNQNPWLEVNLRLLRQLHSPLQEHVDLVRRNSGGGTVFHDHGNVNWTVICPSSRFTKDKHAEMVVRALRRLGIERARVNERHDIVLDQGSTRTLVPSVDMHMTPFTSPDGPPALKVSGSAYKLTRGRALHHGTCLLQSPNLKYIGQFLRSPARPYIKARGVESVSSPITNIGLSNTDFTNAVLEEFGEMYNCGHQTNELIQLDQQEILNTYTVREIASKLKVESFYSICSASFTDSCWRTLIGSSLEHLSSNFPFRVEK